MRLGGKVAWVTGAGSGIGEAVAIALAAEGARVVLSGRRREMLEAVAARVAASGGEAEVQPGDLARPAEVAAIGTFLRDRLGRVDILVNNAGLNIPDRHWDRLTAEGAAEVIGANLQSAFACTAAVLSMMRSQGGGLLVHTASMAGRFIGGLSGPAYTAAKHGVVAMSHSINMAECGYGIRSCALCPGEVATPILDRRPVPVSAEDRALMVQPTDVADLVLVIACLPARICVNEVLVTPTHNRSYLQAQKARL